MSAFAGDRKVPTAFELTFKKSEDYVELCQKQFSREEGVISYFFSGLFPLSSGASYYFIAMQLII